MQLLQLDGLPLGSRPGALLVLPRHSIITWRVLPMAVVSDDARIGPLSPVCMTGILTAKFICGGAWPDWDD